MTTSHAPDGRTLILRSLLVAAAIIAASAALRALAPEHLSNELARRMMQVVLGLVVVAYSNAIPKVLTPLAQLRCTPAAEQAIRRFAGWALTLGGLGYALAWLLAPIDAARPLAMTLLGGALLLVLARLARARLRGASLPS